MGESEGERVKPHALSAGECGVGRKKRDGQEERKKKKGKQHHDASALDWRSFLVLTLLPNLDF